MMMIKGVIVGFGIGAAVFTTAAVIQGGERDVAPPNPHGEYVKYANASGDSILAYLVYPERPDPAPAVVIIHEIFGLSDWIKAVADTLAMQGFVAIAPDFLSRMGGTAGVSDPRASIRELTSAQVMEDLDGAESFVQRLRAVREGPVGVIGFCWGGGRVFEWAIHNPRLGAGVICYGPSPADRASYAHIRAPLLGIYAENDARINQDLPDVEAALRAAGKDFRHTIYPGTGHGFLRTGRPEAEARRGWADAVGFLRERLGR